MRYLCSHHRLCLLTPDLVIRGPDNNIKAPYLAIEFSDVFRYHQVGDEDCYSTFCCSPGCVSCISAELAITVHEDCLEFIKRSGIFTDLFSCIWDWTACRSFWNTTPILPTASPSAFAIQQYIRQVAISCTMPGLMSLPLELHLLIYKELPQNCLFRRYTSAWITAQWWKDRNNSEPQPLAILVNEIEDWHRGAQPKTHMQAGANEPNCGTNNTLIRLSIDSKGLRDIKRLQPGAAYSDLLEHDSAIYIVEAAECFSEVWLEHRVCTLLIANSSLLANCH